MILLALTLNIVGWPVIHLVLAHLITLCPDEYFARDSRLTRKRRFECDGQLYRRAFAVQRWKAWLPDGAPWVGGKSKRRIESRSYADLNAFMIETRRAEVAHWCMLLCTPVFYLWNPAWACIVMSFYGIAANLPCIVAQRANRIKIARILNRKAHTKRISTRLRAAPREIRIPGNDWVKSLQRLGACGWTPKKPVD